MSPLSIIINQLQADLASYRSLALTLAASPQGAYAQQIVQALENMIIGLSR